MVLFNLFVFYLLLTKPLTSVSSIQFSSCNDKYCFHSNGHHPNGLTISKASKECKKLKADSWPLEIYNQKLQDSVMKYVAKFKDLQNTNIFLNLKRIDNADWKWSTGQVYDNKLSVASMRVRIAHKVGPFSTLRNLPNNIIIGDAPPKLSNFLCSYPFSCQGNRSAVSHNNVCYTIISNKTEPYNWFESYNYCYRTGGRLATLADITLATLQIKFRRITTNWVNYWVGLIKTYWGWQHNAASVSNYTVWYSGFPYPGYFKEDADHILTFFRYIDGGIWMDTNGKESLTLVCMTLR